MSLSCALRKSSALARDESLNVQAAQSWSAEAYGDSHRELWRPGPDLWTRRTAVDTLRLIAIASEIATRP